MDQLTRDFSAEVRAAENGTFAASLASDQPVMRYFGPEVLDFGPGCVDLSRARDGLPLLMNHQTDALIGRVSNLRVDGKRLRGVVRFFDNDLGRRAQAAVTDGHREVSIGYAFNRDDLVFDGQVHHVTKWQLLEASIVSVPADPTVGINRAQPKGSGIMDKTNTGGESAIEARNEPNLMTRSQRRQAAQQLDGESKRTESIAALARAYSDHLTPEQVADAVSEGVSVEDFQRQIIDSMQTGAVDVRGFPAVISRRGDPQDMSSRFSIARAIQAQVDPASFFRQAGYEAEVSRELQRSSGLATSGTLVPVNAFFGAKRDMLAGVGGAGSSTVPTHIDPNWIDALRHRSVTVAMRPTILEGLTSPVEIPRKNVTSTVAWQGEVDTSAETNPDFGNVKLSPKRVGGYVEASRQLIITSAIGVENMIADDLRQCVIAELDRAALVGAPGGSVPLGIQNQPGIGVVVGGTNGASLTWQHICDLEKSVDQANGLVDMRRSGYAINPSTRSYCKRTPRHATLAEGLIMGDTPNDEFGRNVLNGYPCAVSSKVPSNLTKGTNSDCSLVIFGDWSQLMLAFFGGGVEIIVDPYTLATKAQVRITANLFCDVGLRQSASFSVMTDARLP